MPETNLDEENKQIGRPELIRRTYYLIVAFAALGIISLIPTPMEPVAQRALGILAFVTILWVTEAFPLGMTALFGVTFLPVLNILPLDEAFYGFKSTALFFLMGSISFGIAMQKTGLHKRFALKFLTRFGRGSSSIIFSVCVLGCFISMTMPEHAVAALLLPVLMGIAEAGDISQRENFGIALFLALTYATSVGSIGTLLGGARNVLALGILQNTTGVSLSFLDWMLAGVPIAVALMLLTYVTLKIMYPWKQIDVKGIRSEIEEEVSEMGPMSFDEKKAAIIFVAAFVLWITVGTRIGLATVAVGGLIMLVVTRTLTWRDIEQNMPWGLLFLYGGALTLSHALVETDAVGFLANNLISLIGNHPYFIMVAFLFLVVLVSNVMSNAAATAVVLPIALSTILALSPIGDYSGKLVAYLISMGSAMAFMLPIATPSAAIAYTSGYIRIKDLAKTGSILTVITVLAFITVGLGWWKLIGVW